MAAALDFPAIDVAVDVGSSDTATLEDVDVTGVILVEDCSGAATEDAEATADDVGLMADEAGDDDAAAAL